MISRACGNPVQEVFDVSDLDPNWLTLRLKKICREQQVCKKCQGLKICKKKMLEKNNQIKSTP